MKATISNFKLVKTVPYDNNLSTQIYVFEHELTGLKVFWFFPQARIHNLKISFYTPQLNNNGTTHLLEHLLCHTQNRYKDKYYLPSYASDYTRFNAVTVDDYTYFELTSGAADEFEKVIKSMIDSIFRKKFNFTDEDIAYESAYIKDFDTVDGVIYNEIKRSIEEIENLADDYMNEIVFAGSHFQYSAGGRVESIPNVTREELEKYYFKYYTLSNCKMFLSGYMDIDNFLRFLDEGVCKFERNNKKAERIKDEESHILENQRLPFYAPLGYPKGENVFVWGLKLPKFKSLSDRALCEAALRAMLDGEKSIFDDIIKEQHAKSYKKSLCLDKTLSPTMRIIFYNVPLGAELEIENMINNFIEEFHWIGITEEDRKMAVEDTLIEYEFDHVHFDHNLVLNQLYFCYKEDEDMFKVDFRDAIRSVKKATCDELVELGYFLARPEARCTFIMYPDEEYINDLEENMIFNIDDYKTFCPCIEEVGQKLAKSFKLNGTKKDVEAGLLELDKSLSRNKVEILNCQDVKVYVFEYFANMAVFAFDLRGLTDKELLYIPVLEKLIESRFPKRHSADVIVDPNVVQTKVKEEYFKLELKTYFKMESVDLSFAETIFDAIENIEPQEIMSYLMQTIASLDLATSDGLTYELAIRMDSNDLPYKGIVHRKTFFNTLFKIASEKPDKVEFVCKEFKEVCYKVLRRSNMSVMATSQLIFDEMNMAKSLKHFDAYDGITLDELVELFPNYEVSSEKEDEEVIDKNVNYHFAHLKASATSVIKVDDIFDMPLGKKMVIERIYSNFIYILFRKLGLSYTTDATISSDYVTITSHSVRSLEDYQSALFAGGLFMEDFAGNINHYKLKSINILLDSMQGKISPKINVFRYLESGISLDEIYAIPGDICDVNGEDLKEFGKLLQDAAKDAKIYVVCGKKVYPSSPDDASFNTDYAFPEFLI